MLGASINVNINASEKDRALHLQRTTRVNRRAREAAKDYVDAAKKRPCSDCGGRFPPFIMDFDHVRGEKLANVSQLRSGRLAWARLEAELAKCEVVCANCHRRRTQLRLLGIEIAPSEILELLGSGYVGMLVY